MTTNFQSDLGTPQADVGGSAGAKEQAKEAAGSAAEQSKHVAGVAQDEVARVASEASSQLRALLQQATSQVEEQSSEQKTRLAETVRTFANDLESMQTGDQSASIAGQVVQQVAQQAREVASRLEGREPRELLDEVRQFARRRPGTFILGALAAGVITGRLTRAGKVTQHNPSGVGTAAEGTHRTVASPVPTSRPATVDPTVIAPIPPTGGVTSPGHLADTSGVSEVDRLDIETEGVNASTTVWPGTGPS